jgi:hypothetical protein
MSHSPKPLNSKTADRTVGLCSVQRPSSKNLSRWWLFDTAIGDHGINGTPLPAKEFV